MNRLQKLYEALKLLFHLKLLLVNSNLCRKLFSSLESPTTFDEGFKFTLVTFFIPGFNLLSCKLSML